MYKNRILNLIILVLILGILGVGGNIIYKNYQYDCEKYNNEIIDFTVELIKGHHTLEDIDALDANEDVKNSLREYYQNTFYSDDDLILVYEDIDFFYKYKDEIAEEQKSFGVGFDNPESNYFGKYSLTIVETEEEQKYNELAITYNYLDEDIESECEFIEKDNNLYVYAKDLDFGSLDIIQLHYKGLNIELNKYGLDKVYLKERVRDNNYQTLEFKNTFYDSDNNFVYYYKNEPKEYRVILNMSTEISMGKIKGLNIDVSN